MLFRSREQIRHNACDFELLGRRYENYSVSVLAYNDFGHYYLHAATPNNDDTNP